MKKSNQAILQFIKTSGVFFIGSVLAKAISILMLPLYTSYIPTVDMGYYDLTLTYVTIATSTLFFDIWVTILRFMYDADSTEEKAAYVRNGLVIFAVSSVVYLIAGAVFGIFTDVKYIWLIMLYGLSGNIANIFTFTARGYGFNVKFAISGIINTCVNVVVNLVLILGVSLDYSSLYIAGIAGCIIQSIYLLFSSNILQSLKKTTLQFSTVKTMFKYSLPLCLNSVSYWLLTSFNRVVINYYYGNSANGIYAIGNKFSFVIALLTTCFTYAWQDIAFSKANTLKSPGMFYSNACDLYCKVLTLGMAVMLPLIKLAFPLLVHDDYATAAETVPLFLIVAIVAAISTFIGNVFYALKDTKTIFYSMLISAVLNIGLSFPLTKYMGIDGANISVIISFVVNILIRNFILRKNIGFALEKKSLWLIPLIVSSYVGYVYLNIWFNLAMLLIIVGIAVFIFRDNLHEFLSAICSRRNQNDKNI